MIPQIKSITRSVLEGVTHLVFPKVCWVCEQFVPDEPGLICSPCLKQLTTDNARTCPRCSASVGEYGHLANGCGNCRNMTYHFDKALRLGLYENRLREVILRMKKANGEILAEIIGQTWANARQKDLLSLSADVVIPMPLHWRRRFTRGYNQAETLARQVAKGLNLKCLSWCLSRVRYTAYQYSLSKEQRKENMRNVFRASRRRKLQGKTVLLIDDVLTTGSTASAAAQALKQAGAKRVYVAVLAFRQKKG